MSRTPTQVLVGWVMSASTCGPPYLSRAIQATPFKKSGYGCYMWPGLHINFALATPLNNRWCVTSVEIQLAS